MTDARTPPSPRRRPPPPSVRGLDERALARPALDVLSDVPWDGARLEPLTTLASVFLANL